MVVCRGGHLSPKALYLALGPDLRLFLPTRGYYRALAGGATIPEDRPVRPDFEKPYLPRLAAARRFDAQHTPKALRRFVIDQLERIDFRRVDKFELV